MRLEVLDKSKWGELSPISLDPSQAMAVVARDEDGTLIGTLFMASPVHLEGLWVRWDRRRGLVMKRLADRCERIASKAGLKKIFAYAIDERMEDYIRRLGYTKSPMTVFEKEVK